MKTTTKSQLILENEKLLETIQTRQGSLNNLSSYLTELESQLALIFAASPDIIVFLNTNADIIKISDAAFTILGYSRSDLVGQSLWSFISHDTLAESKEKFEKIKTSKIPYFTGNNAFISSWRAKDGHDIRLVWRFSLCNEGDERIIGVASDISQLGATTIYNSKILHSAVNSSTDGIVIIEPSSKEDIAVYVNTAYEAMTEREAKELTSKPFWHNLTKEALTSRAFSTAKNCMKSGNNCDVLLQCRKQSGEIFYGRFAISAVKEEGVITHFIGIIRDITEKIGVKYEWSPNTESGFVHLQEK
jgi:PAS domain S-box-containing protein